MPALRGKITCLNYVLQEVVLDVDMAAGIISKNCPNFDKYSTKGINMLSNFVAYTIYQKLLRST